MTRLIVDVAAYQGDLRPADVKRAGFDAVNLKVSHGLSRKSVHPNITGWIDQARALGLGISTFHYLTADSTGEAQARYAWEMLASLGLLYGTAHQLDVEADPAPALSSVRSYLTTMTELLQRPVAVYTGDWWWTARQAWDVSALSPYVWSAPNAGYLGSYPGDTSPHWRAGYGGWAELAVMQYAVGPLSYPNGTRGTIDVSKSAIRSESVWRDLTTGRPGMSYAPETLQDAREFILDTIPGMDRLSVGIVGDDSHAASGTSYHLGKDALKSGSYSVVESSRDGKPTNAAMALDIGWFSVKVGTTTYTLRHFSLWLVAECKAGAPDTLDIREVIYSPDGKVVKRWDRLGRRTSGEDSHLTHTHESWFRDSENRDKTAHLRRYFTEIGYLEDEMSKADITEALTEFFAGSANGSAATGTFTSVIGKRAWDQGIPNPLSPDGAKTEAWRALMNVASAVKALGLAAAADAGRDAEQAAQIAQLLTLVKSLAGSSDALTDQQFAVLREAMAQAASEAGVAAAARVERKVDALREHLGDESATA